MRKSSTAISILLALTLFASCRNATPSIHSIFTTLSAQTVVFPAEDGRIRSPTAGTIVSLPTQIARDAGLGRYVAIQTSIEYPFAGKTETAQFITIIGNLSRKQIKKGTVEKGSDLGTAIGGQAFMIVMADSLNSYLVCSTTTRAENRLGKWWFNGEFLLDDTDNLWLNYLPETSPTVALRQMLEGGKTNNYLLNLHLSAIPEPISADIAFELTAYGEKRTGLEEVESMQSFKDGDKIVTIFWPAGFAQYLKNEYAPGKAIWIFSKLIPCDTDYRKLYIFAREFLLEPLESLYQSRLESYHQ